MDAILLVDDDDQLRASFKQLLEAEGYAVRAAASGEAALAMADEAMPDAVIMDVRMPGLDGLATLRLLREKESRLAVIIMTAYSTTDSAIEATRLGAFDYILKPFEIPEVLDLIRRAIEAGRVMRGQVALAPPEDAEGGEAMVGNSAAMHEIYKAIGRVAPTDALVLLRGESGTGKELAARALYHYSRRSTKPFMTINCVAIPDTLLESELFGYERGAFTGAGSRRIGRIEQAEGGTVFLDEIGDIPLNVQAKLLRLLQERQIERLGGRETIPVNVRIIAATNRDLEEAVATGRFREDLYYRLNVVALRLPPLRERKEDIPHLTRHFLRHKAGQSGLPPPKADPEALSRLAAHAWPGNVRELANLVQKLLIFNRSGIITGAEVAAALTEAGNAGYASGILVPGHVPGHIHASASWTGNPPFGGMTPPGRGNVADQAGPSGKDVDNVSVMAISANSANQAGKATPEDVVNPAWSEGFERISVRSVSSPSAPSGIGAPASCLSGRPGTGVTTRTDLLAPPSPLPGYVARMLRELPHRAGFDALMDEMGAAIIREALVVCKGNRSQTARLLGLSRPTLLAKIDKYGL